MNAESISSAFHRMRTSLKSAAARIIGSDDDADDALQDTFLKLWGAASRIPDSADVEKYIAMAVRNKSLDMVRGRRRDVRLDDIDLAQMSESEPDTDEVFRDVMRIIDDEIPDMQRRILHMRDIERRDFSEIASLLEIPETTVRVYLSRARASVRKIYRLRNLHSNE